jgi:GAF domain-containing protein
MIWPCLHALHTGEGLYVPDLGSDHRWRDYGPRAAELGAASCVSVPVRMGDEVFAVLKAYARAVDGISAEQRALVELVALEVAGGIGLAHHLTAQARELDDREAAMDTRRTIDLALGVLVERTDCSIGEAFTLLRRYSQQYNVKINSAARQVLINKLGEDFDADHAPFTKPGEL